MEKQANAKVTTTKKVLVLALCVALPIAILTLPWLIGYIAQQTSGTTTNDKSLNLKVVTGVSTVEISNNEQTPLGGCKITINDQYSGRVAIEEKMSEYNLATFTKNDGERFNPFTHKVKTIVINDCSEQPGRAGVYTN